MTPTYWLVTAVIIDSFVTMVVGWRLSKVARKETAKAAENVKAPLQAVIQEELARSISIIIPVLAAKVAEMIATSKADDRKPEIAPDPAIAKIGSRSEVAS
jgi:hypothetical protein